ncbi:glycosyltransferase family 4 protein [Pelagovum pacificum]|uniref:Glycosyltransferase family 4 protein n=1 Tax=Pelagovum pacificum TaxID=2588711 RepID=A0A5C5G7V5_9RHOB|nr:glycosyltransferase family 4 protein [Pelagovum pacificum]QQA41930.1 glycosyltransferase family 1 protein [Pelagovum pacificum]TNY30631.1 glycosyltransferase family 4 protein [Pelagovum pacificum]
MARILALVPDLRDAAQLRRLRGLADGGHDVRSASLRKGPAPKIDWPNIDLGPIPQNQLCRRALHLLLRSARSWPSLVAEARAADIILARNFDMLALGRALMRHAPAASLVYEVLDIHGLFEGTSRRARLARAAERAALRRVDLLCLSSPAFYHRWFWPVQRHAGPWHLLENKLCLPSGASRPPSGPPRSGPLRLGWIGSIRCPASLDLLLSVATARPEIELRITGKVHRHALPDFDARINALPNVIATGPYDYPHGLPAAYAECDVVWAQDLWQRGGNSDLLLPNRVYEAGWHGCPLIAVSGTETARRISATGQGWSIDDASPDALLTLIDSLTADRLHACRRHVLSLPSRLFAETNELDRFVAVAIAARDRRLTLQPATA